MDPAELIVYATVWLAVLCYPAAAVGRAAKRTDSQRWARWIWSVGCLAFWLHVVSAFGVFYQWSHSVALAETARQTLAMTGFDSGAGLYLNYLFALAWAVDVAWWWHWPENHRARPLSVFLLFHGFFLFMILNGAVIFVVSPRRWLGVVLFALGLAAVGRAVAREMGWTWSSQVSR